MFVHNHVQPICTLFVYKFFHCINTTLKFNSMEIYYVHRKCMFLYHN